MSIRWVFFDIGDVIFDEDPQHRLLMHALLMALRRHGVHALWDDFDAMRRRLVREKPATAFEDCVRAFAPDEAGYKKIWADGHGEYERIRKPRPYGILLDGIQPALNDLAKDFRLGVIADQHPPVIEALKAYGVAPPLEVLAISEMVGLHKPDPAFFRWALDKTGCAPEESLMVGDRPDGDIAPAKALGMYTLRFRRGLHYALYDPHGPEERADREVSRVEEIPAAVRQMAH